MPTPNPLPLKHKPSSSNINDPPTPSNPHGFRAQINNLIPKHSYFRARLHIHQIDNIPFVNGEFSLRWKFKNARSPPGARQGLLGMVRTRSKPGDHKETSDDNPVPSLVISNSEPNTSSNTRIPSFSSSSGLPAFQNSAYTNTQPDLMLPYPPFSSNSANASRTTLHLPPASTVPTPSSTPTPASAFPPYPDIPALLPNTPSRGSTPFLELKDHSVHWNQILSTIIRFDVERDSGCLLPCPLKLVVIQRVISDDSMSHPQNPRLGAVYLNLSEYVGRGPVERRYLLRESRTNATLKLTVELEFISGETRYNAPPLPKGEILNGLAGYLEEELSRARGQVAHGVDMYGPYRDQEELELDLFGIRRPNKRSWMTQPLNLRDDYESDDGSDSDNEPPAFDVERLPLAYGTKTTETLIEAIFNPVRTSEKRCESPFTFFVPSPPPSRAKSGDRNTELGTRTNLDAHSQFVKPEEAASVYSTESSSGSSGSAVVSRSSHSQISQRSSDPRSLTPGSGRIKEWWKRVAS